MFSFLLCLFAFFLLSSINSDNIDTRFPITFSYQKSPRNSRIDDNSDSHFGYSLVVNQVNEENIVLVGAPKFQSRLYPNVQQSGAIFRCQLNKRIELKSVICTEINFVRVERFSPSTDMHLGSSLITNTHFFIGCSHLWVNTFTSPTPVGKCFQIQNDGTVSQSFGPNAGSSNQLTREGRPLNSHLMVGFASVAAQSDDTLLMGAPGYLDFTGSVIRYIQNEKEQKMELDKILPFDDKRLPHNNSYLGFAMTTGFFDGNIEFIVMGAPRFNRFQGRVLILPLEYISPQRRSRLTEYLFDVKGRSDAFGEYFGASVLALDINNDKFDDLVVGAPYYSIDDKSAEIGRIYVFMNNKNSDFERPKLIVGHTSNGRFGSALAAIDLNMDEFKDVIVGSPFEANSDGSLGAVYVYMGSKSGLSLKPKIRIGAEIMTNPVLKGFGISLISNVDFDGNGYNDILIGSYLSENAVLLRSKPIADLSLTEIIFKPKNILLTKKNCKKETKNCLIVEYCVKYEGKHIRDKQLASVVLDITDSKLRIRENRLRLASSNKTELKTIELRANQRNCFRNDDSFMLQMNDNPFDIITPIEIRLSIELKNETRNKFCPDCAIAAPHSRFGYIEFEHGCHTQVCSARLTLSAVSKYNDQRIEGNLIEGLHDTIDMEISVANSAEAAINTVVVIQMSPVLLRLTNSGDADRCVPMTNSSSYECQVNKVLQTGAKEQLNLHFIVSGLTTNDIEIEFKVQTDSNLEKSSKTSETMRFEIIRKASLMLLSEQSNNFSYSDKISRVSFTAPYTLVKSGPSSVDLASLVIRIPTKIIDLDDVSKNVCHSVSDGIFDVFPIKNGTLELNCDKNQRQCSEYRCQLPKFLSGADSKAYTVSLALIPSTIKDLDFKGINFQLNSELKIDDKIKFESEIKSFSSMTVFMARDVPIIDAKVEPWVLFVSSGLGILILIITIGFFRRKKLEEIDKVRLRMSMRPDMYDLNVLEMDEQDFK